MSGAEVGSSAPSSVATHDQLSSVALLDDAADVEISVVMPCLNEESSVGLCIDWAFEGIRRSGLRGEVIISDNGSTDRSVQIALEHGARVVHQPARGYGNAYLKGFSAARGRYIVMGDSDATYDFRELDRFIALLRDGHDYVLGSRFTGQMEKGAMPWTHKYVGNPVLTGVLNRLFGLKSSDAHSGMRAFTRDALEDMELRCEGMEFASEIVIKAARARLSVAEVPIDYKRREGDSKLKSLRDGWRHLRFMLLLSPLWLFIVPGVVLFALGFIGQSVLLQRSVTLGSHNLGTHFSALFAVTTILGAQATMFGAFSRTYASSLGLEPQSKLSDWVINQFALERGLLTGLVCFLFGFGVDVWILVYWLHNRIGALDAMRPALFALTMMVLGFQSMFASFFLSMLGMKVHAPTRVTRRSAS